MDVGLMLDIEPARDLDTRHIPFSLTAKRDDIRKLDASRHTFIRRDAHLHGKARSHSIATRPQHLQRKPHTILDRAAICIGAMVE